MHLKIKLINEKFHILWLLYRENFIWHHTSGKHKQINQAINFIIKLSVNFEIKIWRHHILKL